MLEILEESELLREQEEEGVAPPPCPCCTPHAVNVLLEGDTGYKYAAAYKYLLWHINFTDSFEEHTDNS